MSPADINAALVAAYQHNGWQTGVMFWQFSSDSESTIISTAISGLESIINTDNVLVLDYPVRFTCINKIYSSSSDSEVLRSMGVPSAVRHGYNYISFYSWTYRTGAQGPLRFWVDPRSFLSTDYKGTRTNSILRS